MFCPFAIILHAIPIGPSLNTFYAWTDGEFGKKDPGTGRIIPSDEVFLSWAAMPRYMFLHFPVITFTFVAFPLACIFFAH